MVDARHDGKDAPARGAALSPLASAQRQPVTQTVGFADAASSVKASAAESDVSLSSTLGYNDGSVNTTPMPGVRSNAGEASGPRPTGEADATAATMAGESVVIAARAQSNAASSLGVDATVAHTELSKSSGVTPYTLGARSASMARTTVLPKARATTAGPILELDNLPRYARLRLLGEGGVGEVTLAQDRDIDRPVALKRLRAEVFGEASLMRFAEEIRTIGRLEHPNIVPVHDVGIDEDGQHFFVMKYVAGETLESIIEKLKAGEPAHVQRFTYETRTQIFLGILQAIQYAHAHGIVHRDIKPANIMVGPYGEVMVMDWGLAKKIRETNADVVDLDRLPATPNAEPTDDAIDSRDRLFKTRHGSLLGTPAYMSPEQARGMTDKIDERSDVYSLCVMFHELLTLDHYLSDKKTLGAMLIAVSGDEDYTGLKMVRDGEKSGAPAEYLHFVRKGLAKDPAARWQSAEAMVERLHAIKNGDLQVQCPVTFVKKGGNEFLHFVDRHPRLAPALAFMSVGAIGWAGVQLVLTIARAVM